MATIPSGSVVINRLFSGVLYFKALVKVVVLVVLMRSPSFAKDAEIPVVIVVESVAKEF